MATFSFSTASGEMVEVRDIEIRLGVDLARYQDLTIGLREESGTFQAVAGTSAAFSAAMEATLSSPAWNDWARQLGHWATDASSDSNLAKTKQQKARRLLLSLLTPAQRSQFRRTNSFIALGSHGGTYLLSSGERVAYGMHGTQMRSYCYQPSKWVPHYDVLLSWKMFIESDEDGFRKGAIPSRCYINRRDLWYTGPERRIRNRIRRMAPLVRAERATMMNTAKGA